MKRILVLLLILFFCFTVLIFCKKSPTDSETVSLSGTVKLEGMDNHADIKVSLYALAEPDSELAAIKQEYPNLGAELSQEVLFDHRQQNAISQTSPTDNGIFTFYNVEPGIYNLVAEKEGFGWRYLHNVEITQSGQEPVDIALQLYKKINLSGLLPQETTLLQDHHYHATADVIVPAGGTLEIEPGVTIEFDRNVALVVNGTLESQGENNNYIWLTSSQPESYFWKGMENILGDSKFNLGYTKIDYGTSALSALGGIVTVNKCFISYNERFGIYIGQSETFYCYHSIFSISYKGVRLEAVANAKIRYNIFTGKGLNNESIGFISNTSIGEFNNNVIQNIETAIVIEYRGNALIQHNHIIECKDGIMINFIKDNKCKISNNTFEKCYRTAFNIYRNGFPQIQFNNIWNVAHTLILGGFYNDYSENIIVSNNFWETSFVEDVIRRIKDTRNNQNNLVRKNYIIKPILSTPLLDAKPK
jgi:hypothetical protein